MRLGETVGPSTASQGAVAVVWKTRLDTSEPNEARLWVVRFHLVEAQSITNTYQHKFNILCCTSKHSKAIFINDRYS